MINQFMLMFMLIPCDPGKLAAYSIVGEKQRSLEFHNPITTILGNAWPSHTSRWHICCRLGSWGHEFGTDNAVLEAFFDTRWLIAIFITGPLLALIVSFSLMVSSRVNDPRVAEQISMVIIVPVLGGFFGQVAGLFVLNKTIILWVSIILVIIDGGLLYIATRVFQRETILTRWK
jgi:ABC-2 type transport system permease protein